MRLLFDYDFYNLQSEGGKANFLSEKTYMADTYQKLKENIRETIDIEKQDKQFSDFGKVMEENLDNGKAFYYQRKLACAGGGSNSYVSYNAYLLVPSGFIQFMINYYGSVDKVKLIVKEMVTNIKVLDSYDYFTPR